MSASMYPNHDEQLDRTLHSSLGSGESSFTVTGVNSQYATTSHPTSQSQHGTHLENPQSSGHTETHAYPSHRLSLQLTEGLASRLPPANPPATSAPPPSTPNTLQCEQCYEQFTGEYRKANRTRHVRDQHTLVKGITHKCTVAACDSKYTRPDNLLKHERKCHPGLRPDPVKRNNDKKTTATTSSRRGKGSSKVPCQSGKRPAQTNRGSAPQALLTPAPPAYSTRSSHAVPNLQQAPNDGSLAHDLSDILTSTSTDDRPSFADVRGAGNWLLTVPTPDDPAVGEDQDFQQLHHGLQQAIALAPSHQAADSFLLFGQHDLASYNRANQESWPSSEHLYPPGPAQNYGHSPSPATVSGYLGTTDMSSIPSNQGFDTASSSYFPSTYAYTGPTSIHDPVDAAHHSPLASPFSFQSRSLQSAVSPYSTHQDILTAQEPLPEHQQLAIPVSDASFFPSEEDADSLQELLNWSPPLDEGLVGQSWSDL